MALFYFTKKYTGKGVQMEDCLNCKKEHTFRIETIEEDMKEGKKALIEHKIKIEKTDEAVKSAHKRIDEIGEIPHAVLRISLAVENMTEEVKELALAMKEHQKEMNDRIDTLEKNPGQEAYEREKQVKNYIFMAIVGAIVGSIFMKLGVKL